MKKSWLCFLFIAAIVSGCNRDKIIESKDVRIEPEVMIETNDDTAVGELEPAAIEEQIVIQPLTNHGTWIASASSQEAALAAPLAIDGDMGTRWSSDFKDGQWWMVDFGREERIGRISLNWETAYAKKYKVLLSTNQIDWTEVFAESQGQGGVANISFDPRLARFVKVECLERATQWGSSLLEVQFNPEENAKVEESEMEATASSGVGDYAPKFAIDGKMDTRWSSNFGDTEWWQVKFAKPRVVAGLKISWETAFAEKYEVAVSMDGENWQKVYSVSEGDGRTDLIFFKPVETRFVRIQCLQRGTGWGNSIYEIKFFEETNAPAVTAVGSHADFALDGDPSTVWHSEGDGEQSLTVKLPEKMNLGGMEMLWGADYAAAYTVECSADGSTWIPAFSEKNGNGAKDYIFFPAMDAQYIRILMQKSSAGQGYAIAQLEFKGGEEQATPIRAYQAKARDSKVGFYPMWLTRQQEFWTVVGLPDDEQETLIGETGTIEPHKGDFCVTPFVIDDGKLVTWADVKLDQRLEDHYLPMPSTRWTTDRWMLDISAVAFGPVGESSTAVRYRLINTGAEPFNGKLALAVRPFELNPIWQHGGLSPIREAECSLTTNAAQLKINGLSRMEFPTMPVALGTAPLADGDTVDFLARGDFPTAQKASDSEGKTGAGALFDLQVPAGGTADVVVVYRLHDHAVSALDGTFDDVWSARRAAWKTLLDNITIDIPEQRLIDVMKSNFGYVLINRDGPWFKPGSRNYNHSWMRDGALTGVAMLRMGMPDLPREFIKAFSGFVTDSGWVPFMILEDGKPVGFNSNPNGGEGQEYDSQGEYPFIVRQYYDFTGDEALVREVYPKVVKALRYAQELRRRRMTDEYRNNPVKQDYYGILPESNSHEGYYPAKHSYWDDFWVLKGFKDGIHLAQKLGETNDVEWMTAEEKDFRTCLYDSILRVIRRAHLNFIPGCVELADTDPTSTTIAIMACDEATQLPEPYGTNTFNVYWENFSPRLTPGGEQTFTPYESRNADVFFRIGQRARGLAVLRYFTSSSTRPYGWNHLAEVVHAKMRAPSYIGDMPHTWCGSDYINAVRSIFAYEQYDSLVLAAGVDPKWLEQGVRVKNLPTQFGAVNYEMKRQDAGVTISVDGPATPPAGFSIPLPESLAGMSATMDGQPVQIENGSLRFQKLPVTLRLTPAL